MQFASAAGTWVAQGLAPTIKQRGYIYKTKSLKPRPTTPLAGQFITTVSWTHDYQRWLPGFQARLCAQDQCIDASKSRGQSKAFAGWPIDTTFKWLIFVEGQGRIYPPISGRYQLFVNFE